MTLDYTKLSYGRFSIMASTSVLHAEDGGSIPSAPTK